MRSGVWVSRFIVIGSNIDPLPVNANAGLATAIIWLPEAATTCTPKLAAVVDSAVGASAAAIIEATVVAPYFRSNNAGFFDSLSKQKFFRINQFKFCAFLVLTISIVSISCVSWHDPLEDYIADKKKTTRIN